MLALRERWLEKNVVREAGPTAQAPRVARRRRPRKIRKSDVIGYARARARICTQNDGRKGARAYLSSTDRKPSRSSGVKRHPLEEGRALRDARRAEPRASDLKPSRALSGGSVLREGGEQRMLVKSAQLPGWTRESQQAATCVRHQCTFGRQEKSTAQAKPRKQRQMQSGMVAS